MWWIKHSGATNAPASLKRRVPVDLGEQPEQFRGNKCPGLIEARKRATSRLCKASFRGNKCPGLIEACSRRPASLRRPSPHRHTKEDKKGKENSLEKRDTIALFVSFRVAKKDTKGHLALEKGKKITALGEAETKKTYLRDKYAGNAPV